MKRLKLKQIKTLRSSCGHCTSYAVGQNKTGDTWWLFEDTIHLRSNILVTKARKYGFDEDEWISRFYKINLQPMTKCSLVISLLLRKPTAFTRKYDLSTSKRTLLLLISLDVTLLKMLLNLRGLQMLQLT